MLKQKSFMLVLFLGVVSAFALKGPKTSNGFDHFIFWNGADSSFYHVNRRGAATDTHLVKRYQATVLARDTVLTKVGSVGYIKDTAYQELGTYATRTHRIFRNDTQIVIDTLTYYNAAPGGSIVLTDTLIALHVGALGRPLDAVVPNFRGLDSGIVKGDYLIVNGKRTMIKSVGNDPIGTGRVRFWVDARDCPPGINVNVNATFRTLPNLKTFSTGDASKWDFFEDPHQKNKLYLFYISDSGRIVSQVSWDNGLTWDEMYEATKNPVLTDTSDLSRSNLNVSINGSGVISLSWTGAGTTSTTLNVPGASLDTVVMYVNPRAAGTADQQFTTTTNVASFKAAMTPATAFKSIDRCINQMIMLENGVVHSELRNYSRSDTAMGNTRAVLTRFYNIKILPGDYYTKWGDSARTSFRVVPWNVVYSPGRDRGIKVESYYSNPESLATVNLSKGSYENNFCNSLAAPNGANLFRAWTPEIIEGVYANNGRRIERWFPVLNYIEISRLKVRSEPHSALAAAEAGVASFGNRLMIRGVVFANNLFYSVDSSAFAENIGKGTLSKFFSIEGIGTGTSSDNIVFVGNMFHRLSYFSVNNGWHNHRSDYSGGMIYANNTFFKWLNGFNNRWSHGGFHSKVTYLNNISDSAPTPYSGYNTRNAGYLLNDSLKNIFTSNNSFNWIDTIPCLYSFLKIPETSPAASGGADVITLDSIWKSDFYGVKTSGSRHIGATVPPPTNPLGLQLSMDTIYTPGVRTIKVKILNKGMLAGNVDTIKIFRDTLDYILNPYASADAAYRRSVAPDSYYSANVPMTYYFFTVVVGVKQDNGNVSWSGINPSVNGAMIMLPDAVPPRFAFVINDEKVAADSIRFKIYSPVNYGLPREPDLKKVWIHVNTDSAALVAGIYDTLLSYASYDYIKGLDMTGYIYADTSDEIIMTNLQQNTRYFIAAVSMDSSTNMCVGDTVVKYMRSFRTKQAPQNVLRVSADTIAGNPDKLLVTISQFGALPSSPVIDSVSGVRLFVRYTGYVTAGGTSLNTSTFRDSLIDIRTSIVGGNWVGTISRLPVDSTIFLSVTVKSVDGYYSRIAIDTNTFSIRTPRNPDNIGPNLSGVALDATRPVLPAHLNGLFLRFKISNIDAVPERDRSTMSMKVMWDTLEANVLDPNRTIPGQEILPRDQLLSNSTPDITVSRGILPGRLYYFAAYAQDTAANWSTAKDTHSTWVAKLSDTVSTPPNASKPENGVWSVDIEGYTRLRVTVPSRMFTNVNPSELDSNDLSGIGIWILDTTQIGFGSALNVDSLLRFRGSGLTGDNKFIFLDSNQLMELNNPARGALTGKLDTVILRHNKKYHIICSPVNLFNNWASTTLDQSRYFRATLFDSSLISRPPNSCSLHVSAMKDPDSVRVYWALGDNKYYDFAPLINSSIDYDSVLLYYRTDGSFPQRVGLDSVIGVKIAAFKVTSSSFTRTVSVPGVLPGVTYRFAAFPINGVSRAIAATRGNRMASDTSRAQSGPVTPPHAPDNFMAISLSPDTGSALAIRVNWEWTGGAASAPHNIRLLYRMTEVPPAPPVSYADSWIREDFANAARDTAGSFVLTRLLQYKTLYAVAAFNGDGNGVWSKTSMAGQLGTLYDTVRTRSSEDTIAPPNNLTLSAMALTSRSIELTWADPTNSLPGIDADEGGNISLYYGIKTNKSMPYVWKQIYDTTAFDSVRNGVGGAQKKFVLSGNEDGIYANRTYYLAIAPADGAGNTDGTPLVAQDSVVLTIPQPTPSSVVVRPLSDTAFSIDYAALRTITETDSFINTAIFIISDSGRVSPSLFADQTVKQDLLNGDYNTSSRTGRTFLVRARELASTSNYVVGPQDQIKLDPPEFHYVSVSYLSGGELSSPIFIDSVQYKLDRPLFKTASAVQLNDSIVRLTFRPYDSTDAKVGVQVKYAVSPASPSTAYQTFDQSQHIVSGSSFAGASAGMMVLDRDSTYVIDLRLTSRYFFEGSYGHAFRANDTNTFSLRFLVSDLHGPVPNAYDDSTLFALSVDTKAPGTADSSVTVEFRYEPTPQKLTVLLSAKNGKVDYVRYKTADTASVWRDSVSMRSVLRDTVELMPVSRCILSIRDSLGNKFDTAWSFFDEVALPIVKGARDYDIDNGQFIVSTTVNSVTDSATTSVDTLVLNAGKRQFTQVELDSIRANGFAAVPATGYYFVANRSGTAPSSIWQDGLIFYAAIDSLAAGDLIGDVRIYRYDLVTKEVLFVPYTQASPYDALGRLVVSGIKPPVVSGGATPATSDTLVFFMVVDTVKTRLTDLTINYESSTRSLRLIVKGGDNSRNLTARVTIVGNTAPSSAKKEYARYTVSNVRTVNIDTTFIITDTAFSDVLKRGLFAAAWITDREASVAYRNRRAFAYTRCAFSADTLRVRLKGLSEGYQLVSVPYALPAEYDDVLLTLKEFTQGKYDRNNFRLYALDNNGAPDEFRMTGVTAEGVETNPKFRFTAGKSFFMRVRKPEDNDNVTLKLTMPASVPINSQRGYLVATRAGDHGWVLCNLPFLGMATVGDMEKASSLRLRGASLGNNKVVLPLGERIFENPSSWTAVRQRAMNSGDADVPVSFAVYLYAGESLFVPVVVNDDDFTNYGGRVAKSSINTNEWRVNALLLDGNGRTVDATAVMAISANGSAELPDLPVMNDSRSRLSVVAKGGHPLSYEQRAYGRSGEIWNLEVANGSESDAEYKVLFAEMVTNLPEGWQVWVDDPVRGYAIDVMKSGAVSVVVNGGGSRALKVVAGTASFVAKNVSATAAPKTFSLAQNYPNPFNPATSIKLDIPESAVSKGLLKSKVVLDVYDMRGRLVNRLLDMPAEPGFRQIAWNGKTAKGVPVSSGLYVYRVQIKDAEGRELYNKTKKMTMLK